MLYENETLRSPNRFFQRKGNGPSHFVMTSMTNRNRNFLCSLSKARGLRDQQRDQRPVYRFHHEISKSLLALTPYLNQSQATTAA
jgi:hypothetical protein